MKTVIEQIIEKSGIDRGVEAQTPEGLVLQGLAVLIRQARIEGKSTDDKNFADWLYEVGLAAEKIQPKHLELVPMVTKTVTRSNSSLEAKARAWATLFWLSVSQLSKIDPDHWVGYVMSSPVAKSFIRDGWFEKEDQ